MIVRGLDYKGNKVLMAILYSSSIEIDISEKMVSCQSITCLPAKDCRYTYYIRL